MCFFLCVDIVCLSTYLLVVIQEKGKDVLFQSVKKEFRPLCYKTFSCSAELSMKFQLLMKIRIPKNKDFSSFKTIG